MTQSGKQKSSSEKAAASRVARQQQARAEAKSNQMLVERKAAAVMLGGVHTDTLARMEKRGQLQPIRLTPSKSAKVFYRMSEIRALVDAVTKETGAAQ